MLYETSWVRRKALNQSKLPSDLIPSYWAPKIYQIYIHVPRVIWVNVQFNVQFKKVPAFQYAINSKKMGKELLRVHPSLRKLSPF